MRKPVRALCIILMCTVFLVLGTRASDGPHNTFFCNSEELLNSILNENIEYPPGVLDAQIDDLLDFVSDNQLVSTWTESIEMEDYMPSSSDSAGVYYYDMEQPMEYTEQTGLLPSFDSIFCEPSTEYPLSYYLSNEPVHKYAETEKMCNYNQPTDIKRQEPDKKENTLRKKQKKRNKSTASSIDTESTDNNKLNSNKIKISINAWNNARLKNRHRESLHLGYKPAVAFNKIGSNIYKEIGDEMHQSAIETYVKHCKTVYSEIPIQNEFWFAIASRSTYIHTKHADCKVMNANPLEYKFIEGLSGYYPGLPGDIVKYMDKHGTIVSDHNSIKKEWTETLGDIYIRTLIESKYGIGKEAITFESYNEYRPMATSIRMILALPEIHKDLSNLTVKFIEKTFREDTDSNHLLVVKVLHTIVLKHKSSSQPEIDREYAVLYNAFRDILQQTCVSYESMVIQLYAEMYKNLVYFYEKAEVCEILDKKKANGEKEYYLLAGKFIIKPQRYLKCTTTIDLNKPVGEYTHQITEETNKWTISSEVQKHYHIHYVNNTKQQYTRVCMPMYLNKYIHTISQIVKYLKILYDIEKEECICPYIRDNSGYWMCIQEEYRDKTVQEFADYNIAFYYIEEEIKDGYFTFAEFESYIQPEGETICIPLFLSPLMRSAVSMGPFEEKDKKEHTVIDSMQSMCLQPSVYAYEEKYKEIEHSHVHHYYSNLYIQRDSADVPTIDCYIMDSKAIISNNTAIVEWYAKVPKSVDEYTHCILSDELRNDQDKYDKFRKAVKSQEYAPDSALYGFCLQSSLEKTRGLDGVGYRTYDSIDPSNILYYKLNIVPIYKISANPKIANIQSTIYELDKKIEQITMKIKEPGITEEQKNDLRKKRNSIYKIKYNNKQKLEKIQPEYQLLIKEKLNALIFPFYASFLVFRHSNTQTKSGLGAHNEILDALTYRYNSYNPK